MSKAPYLTVALIVAGLAPNLNADSLWDRRDPNTAYLFNDLNARRLGDVLTILVEETTGSDSQEKREMAKATAANMAFSGNGSTSSLGQVLRSFADDFGLNSSSNRTFDGKANTTIDRKFTDRMSVIVVAVLPNGNIVIEGLPPAHDHPRNADPAPSRHRPSRRHRPVQHRAIAVHRRTFASPTKGKGPESTYTNQGWGGRIFNKLWPF